MFTLKYFQKGTAHISSRQPDPVDKLKAIIARHYPKSLTAR
ncbi:DUF4942 domain-containing protein [Jejubacter calystegiae]|uniref:DUF4942 domain-containing protein n=1 Tax=Jejubacter calystegiae TaxID=2579935 RepID=A0A4P8YJV5_9ENTR|nr:DUF4942 domain-containing protein [Jejubacter calystegiae]